MFLEQKQIRVLVVYKFSVRLSAGILYTTTAPENRSMPILKGTPRESRISIGILVVYIIRTRKLRLTIKANISEPEELRT